MKQAINSFIALLLVIFFTSTWCWAQESEPTLAISGEVITPLTLNYSTLKQLSNTSVTVKDKDGKEVVFKGVLLSDLLKKAGVTLGKELRGENLLKYVVVTAGDGYEVLLTLAEIDPEFSTQKIVLALEKNNQPLNTNEGPFRLIIPNDKRPARWIREARSIRVFIHQD